MPPASRTYASPAHGCTLPPGAWKCAAARATRGRRVRGFPERPPLASPTCNRQFASSRPARDRPPALGLDDTAHPERDDRGGSKPRVYTQSPSQEIDHSIAASRDGGERARAEALRHSADPSSPPVTAVRHRRRQDTSRTSSPAGFPMRDDRVVSTADRDTAAPATAIKIEDPTVLRPDFYQTTKAGSERQRLALACQICRQKKVKCDGSLPQCGRCTSESAECRPH